MIVIKFINDDSLKIVNAFVIEDECSGGVLPNVGDVVSLKTREREIKEREGEGTFLSMCYVVTRKVICISNDDDDIDVGNITIQYGIKEEPPTGRKFTEEQKRNILQTLSGG